MKKFISAIVITMVMFISTGIASIAAEWQDAYRWVADTMLDNATDDTYYQHYFQLQDFDFDGVPELYYAQTNSFHFYFIWN